MTVECHCGCEDRSKCGCPQDCDECGEIIALSGGDEWPESGPLYCWDCMYTKLTEAMSALQELHDFADVPRHHRQSKRSEEAFKRAADILGGVRI